MESNTFNHPPLDEYFWRLKACQDESAKSRLLEEIGRQAPAVAGQLEQMLAAELEIGSFMQLPKDVTAASTQAEVNSRTNQGRESGSLDSEALETIGPYKILEPIGEGGMGIVYLAQQFEPVRRKVAIKVIKPGMDSRQVIARFEAERQALAMMNHPNIARVLDAGTTPLGRPYFVMELVKGIPIAEYCDLANMEVPDRLALFRSICAAVQHAHNKGIIHRDLKPSNVLVTEQDGEPVVKVIDFGVAKALTVSLTEKTLYTGLFQIIGTPSYMSPEQASLSSLDVDVRSDVYSLGVILYELISGTLPIDREQSKGMSIDELRKQICETEPPRPSRRLSTVKERWETIASARGIRAHQIPLLINDELDWIVMRALERERSRRYQSASELAEDVRRYMVGETVAACPPTLFYRSRKFASRYRTLLITSLIIFAVLTCATIVSIQQAFKASRATVLAIRNERLAEAKSNALSEVLYAQDMIAAGQYHLDGEQHRVEQILRRHESPDDAGTRGFEWYFVKALKPVATDTVHQAEDAINDFVLTSDSRRCVIADSSGDLCWIDPLRGVSLGTVKAEQAIIYDIEISIDDQLFSCGQSGDVWCFRWDGNGDRLVPVKQIPVCGETLFSLAVDANATTLWAGSENGRVYEIDVQSGKHRIIFDVAQIGKRPIRDLELAGDNELLVALGPELICLDLGQRDQNGHAQRHWFHAPERGMASFRDIEQNSNRTLIAAGQLLGLVTLFREASPRPEIEFSQLMPADVHSVALSPDGQWLAAGDSAGLIHLLPTEINRRAVAWGSSAAHKRGMKSWKAHEGKIRKLAFVASAQSDGGMVLASVSRDRHLVISDPFASTPARFMSVNDLASPIAPPAVAIGLLWAEQVSDIHLRRPESWRRILQTVAVNDSVECIDLHEAGQVGVMINRRTLIQLPKHREAADPIVLWKSPADCFAASFAISPDATHFAICVQQSQPTKHRIETYESGQQVPLQSVESNFANDMTFSPDGKSLAVTINDDIALVDLSRARPPRLLHHHIDSINDLEYSPDGRLLGSVSGDRSLAVWDAHSGQLLWSERAHENRSNALAFHPTLSTIATVGADSVVRFWSTREGISDDANRLVGEYPLDVGVCEQISFDEQGQSLFIRHGEFGITELRGQFEAADQSVLTKDHE